MVVLDNPLTYTMMYLGALLIVILVGLTTNYIGGLVASAFGVFIVIFVSQFLGIHPLLDHILETSGELVILPLCGWLAGRLAYTVESVQRSVDHWMQRAKKHEVYDDRYDSLKPEWAKIRLDEEILRAKQFHRPLSVVLMQLVPNSHNSSNNHNGSGAAERHGALRALIRVARTATVYPGVVAYLDHDQVLVILPEQTEYQAAKISSEIQNRLWNAVYFPMGKGYRSLSDKSLGKPFTEWGKVQTGVVAYSEAAVGEDLLVAARKQIAGSDGHV